MLVQQGSHDDAVVAMRQAVYIYRTLTISQPDTFLADLAHSLNDLAYGLSALELGSEALAASREATDIRRLLAKERPEEFMPRVADSLDTTADLLVALGRHQEADTTARDGLAILQPFLAKDPNARRIAEELGKKLLK